MAPIADLERFLERVFERTSARLFHSRIHAVQVERHVERAMEAGRRGRGTSAGVPSRYRVRLHPADLDDLATRSGDPQALATRVADHALAFARLHGYRLSVRPIVSIAADPSMEAGQVEVDALEGSGQLRDGPPSDVPVVRGRAESSVAPAPPERVAAGGAGTPAHGQGAAEPATPPAGTAPHDRARSRPTSSVRGAGDRPYAARPVAPPAARALLRVSEPGRREREVRVEGVPLTLGRAPDNGLVILDARVSRHHGRFRGRNGTLVYSDLGSLNGTRVNGVRVDEIVLGIGDRLQVGDAVVIVEQLPG